MNEHDLYAQIDELKQQLRALADENATLRYERDVAESHVARLLPKATPEEEEEMRRLMATAVPLDLASIIRDIEAEAA